MEGEVGSIETGKFADMIDLDQNLFEVDASEIDQLQVLQTFMYYGSSCMDSSNECFGRLSTLIA